MISKLIRNVVYHILQRTIDVVYHILQRTIDVVYHKYHTLQQTVDVVYDTLQQTIDVVSRRRVRPFPHNRWRNSNINVDTICGN